eukprot:Nk52_evm1s1173 gene=Nk52_evmTU1s1173
MGRRGSDPSGGGGGPHLSHAQPVDQYRRSLGKSEQHKSHKDKKRLSGTADEKIEEVSIAKEFLYIAIMVGFLSFLVYILFVYQIQASSQAGGGEEREGGGQERLVLKKGVFVMSGGMDQEEEPLAAAGT